MQGYQDPEVAVQMAGEKLPEEVMPKINEEDALKIAREYYGKTYKPKEVDWLIATLSGKADIAGLVQYAFNAGVNSQKGE